MELEEFVKKDCGMTDYEWKKASNRFHIRYRCKPEPWQIASGFKEPNEEYLQWIGRAFQRVDTKVAVKRQQGKKPELTPELIEMLKNVKIPDTSVPRPPSKNEGRVFRGLESSMGDTAKERKEAVDQIVNNLQASQMTTEGIFGEFIKVANVISKTAMQAGLKIDAVREIREWVETLRAYVVPVAAALKTAVPMIYWNLIQLVSQALVTLVPEIVGWINDILVKVGKEAIVYTAGGLIASPVGSPIIGLIL